MKLLLIKRMFGFIFLVLFLQSPFTWAEDAFDVSKIPEWTETSPGLFISKARLTSSSSSLFDSELYVVRFSLDNFELHATLASDASKQDRASVSSIANGVGAVAAINGSFFGVDGKPLGLIRDHQGKQLGSVQLGGKLLTGVFVIENGIPRIIHRSEVDELFLKQPLNISCALQAGPRLIAGFRPTKLTENNGQSRRSGIAITRDGEILLYATALRFPGASLLDIQMTLLELGLPVADALNLDGGGSSQLYVRKTLNGQELLISGGDAVPVALTVHKRSPN